ncbi:MAG TPA: GAF domain-containing protein [Pirellulales bacterium]|nr:GAF domain-containing protein [Pirellulales bacterium]
MTKPTPDYLRLVHPAADPAPACSGEEALLARLGEAFRQATGWLLAYEPSPPHVQNPNLVWSAPVSPGVGASLGLISVGSSASAAADPAIVPLPQAVALAEVIAQLWGEIAALADGLRAREAELAADVPVVARSESPRQTAERFTAILQAGAAAVGCQASALYLLDSGTTTLKMRAAWGLPPHKLLEPARPLAGALGDLEALLGHAVVLADADMQRYWHAPEPAGAAVCVPVSSPSTPLGTLWLWCDTPRDFSDVETNLIEVVAGRLAAELEREVLLADARQNLARQRRLSVVAERHSDNLPQAAPHLDGWQVAGRLIARDQTLSADVQPATAFFDWFAAADGSTALALGSAAETGFDGALVAAQLRSALRAQAAHLARLDQALLTVHEVLSSLSAGTAGASLFCALVEPQAASSGGRLRLAVPSRELRFSAAGQIQAVVLSAEGCRPLVYPSEPLASALAPGWSEIRTSLAPGESLLVVAGSSEQRWPAPAEWLRHLSERLPAPLPGDAEALADAAAGILADAELIANQSGELAGSDSATAGGALLVLRPV